MKSMNKLIKHGKTMTLAVVASFFAVSSIYACNSSSEDSAEANLAQTIQKELKKNMDQKMNGEVTFYFTVNENYQIEINGISGDNEALNYAVFKQFDFVITEEGDLVLTGINGKKMTAEMLSRVGSVTDHEFPVQVSFQEGI